MTENLPISGVIGVVANSAAELDEAVSKELGCVEVRADLLFDCGMQEDELLTLISRTKSLGLGCLFTLRHPSHGGKFAGTESERIELNKRALAAGADIIDLEWDSAACKSVAELHEWPVIVSYHDFKAMPSAKELNELTGQMLALKPAAIKVVPTAKTTTDSVEMLQWVAATHDEPVKRIGFAMGEAGAFSRVLTTAFGGALTYAAFGDVVAPGQVSLDNMLGLYRVDRVNSHTGVVAVVGSSATTKADTRACQSRVFNKVVELNRSFANESLNQVAIGFPDDTRQSLDPHSVKLRISQCIET